MDLEFIKKTIKDNNYLARPKFVDVYYYKKFLGTWYFENEKEFFDFLDNFDFDKNCYGIKIK